MSDSYKNRKEKQGRLIALVIAGSVLIWSVMQGVAPSLGISARYMLMIDLFTLISLSWSLFSLYKLFINYREKKG
tara:strand:- start:1608 stop:1832 length:225 start_codon:yes stop_codon:yes gene_type:complete